MPRVSPAPKRFKLATLFTHELGDYGVGLGWNASGDKLAAASVSGPIDVLKVGDGSLLHRLSGHGFGTAAIAWQPQGKKLASVGQDGKGRIWDVDAGTALAELPGGAAWVERLAWSPDGSLLATAAGKSLKLWKASGELMRDYPKHPGTINDIGWSSSEKPKLATCAYGVVQLFRVGQDDPIIVMHWKGASLVLTCSPNGKYIATGDQDCTVHFWRPDRASVAGDDAGSMMSGFPVKVRNLVWDASSRYLATDGGSAVCLWDCSDPGPEGRAPKVVGGEEEEILLTALAFQRPGTLLASGDEAGRVRIWDPTKSKKPLVSVQGPAAISKLAWSPDDKRLAVADEQGNVVCFELQPE